MEPLAATDPAGNLRVVLRGPLPNLIAARISTGHLRDSAMHFEYRDDKLFRWYLHCTRVIRCENSKHVCSREGSAKFWRADFNFGPENQTFFCPIKYVESEINANGTHTWIAKLTTTMEMIWMCYSGELFPIEFGDFTLSRSGSN